MEPIALIVGVRDFALWEIVVMGIVAGLGIGFLTWLLAGHFERRGGFGKK